MISRTAAAFAFGLLAFAPGASAQSFNAQEQAEIRAIVRDYLVRNPDVLKEALDSLETRTAAERLRRIENDPRDFSVGPADAPITIVEFYDYRCPYCHAALEWVSDLTRRRRDVRVVFKEFPILGPQSLEAARAALAAKPQNRYFAFHRALMSFTGDLTSERIDQLARQSGINVAQMRARMEHASVTEHLQETQGLAVSSEINSTPSFIINGVTIRAFRPQELEARLREASEEVRAARQASR